MHRSPIPLALVVAVLAALLLVIPAALPHAAASANAQVAPDRPAEPTVTVSAPDNVRALAEKLEAALPAALADIEAKVHARLRASITIVLVNSTADLRRDVNDRFDTPPTRVPDTTAGLAYPRLGILYLNLEVIRTGVAQTSTFEAGVQATFKHELCHLILNQHQPRTRWPAWFEEGLAQWVEREQQTLTDAVLSVRAGTHSLPPLAEISERIDDRRDLAVAYAMSESAVRALFSRVSAERLPDFYDVYARTDSFPLAFESAFGLPVSEFEADWRTQVQPGGVDGLITFFGVHWWWMLFVAAFVIALFGMAARRRRHKALMQQWEEEEEMGISGAPY